MKTFKSILAFQKHFDTNEKCLAELELERWGTTPACPFCGTLNVHRHPNGKKFNCKDKGCRKIFSATVGTIFENSKLPLTKWYLAIYILSVHSKGISSAQLATWLDCTQKTAWFLNHRIREMLAQKNPQLSGMVEVDETYVGGKFKNKKLSIRKAMKATSNSHDHKTAVMGLVQRDGKVITQVVKNTRRETVLPIVINNITLGTELHTDSSWMYTPLAAAYKHNVVNHNQNEYVRGNVHTNTIEGFWSLLKRQIVGIHHNVSPQHLQRYCNESSYRYNNRTLTQDEKFSNVLANCEGRLKYQDLIARVDEQ